MAQSGITYVFTASNSIARPITIKSGVGTYTLYDEVRIERNPSWWEAYDANGNKIMQPSASKDYHSNGPTILYYHLTTLYPNSGSSYSSNSTYNSSSNRQRSSHKNQYDDPRNHVVYYSGNYYNPPYYRNRRDYIEWKIPTPPSEQKIINPKQYVGKWIFPYRKESNPDKWTVDIELDGDQFVFWFNGENYRLYRQENDNNWLFTEDSYSGMGTIYEGDCNSDADPGFPTSGVYYYNREYTTWYYRLTLMDSHVRLAALLCSSESRYMDGVTYREIFVSPSWQQAPIMERYYTEKEKKVLLLKASRNSPDSIRYFRALDYYLAKEYDKSYPIAKDIYLSGSGYWKGAAAIMLGVCYWNGYGVEKDLATAYHYNYEAYEIGVKNSAANLGWIAFDGYSPDMNTSTNYLARKWFQTAVEEFDDPEGYWGQVVMNKWQIRSWTESVMLLKQAASKGHSRSQAFYGKFELLFNHPKEAKELFQKAMDAGERYSFDWKISTMMMLCDFFIANPQYSLYHTPCWGYGSGYSDDIIDAPHIYESDNCVVVAVAKDNKMGFLKISYDGKLLSSTPIIYVLDDIVGYNKEDGLFKVNVPNGEYSHGVWIDIDGNIIRDENYY